jgi:hypothetical protein
MATKPTKPRDANTVDPFSHLDDLDDNTFDVTDSSSGVPADSSKSKDSKKSADLPSASGADTRRRSQINPNDQMRDLLGRIDRSQLAPDVEGGVEPEPEQLRIAGPDRDQLPAVLSRGIRVGGQLTPDWHTLSNLPGYRDPRIRGMGRSIFGMMTRTPIDSIQTISHVAGQGPNSMEEVRAVAAWLSAHAEDLGAMAVSHGPAIPGYEPEVRNYRALGVIFHVVRDPAGYYIYAWPAQDNLTGAGNLAPRLTENQGISMKNKLTESVKLWEMQQDLQASLWTQQLVESLLQESTLSRIIGDTPGGQAMTNYLHKRHRLSNTAEYVEHALDSGERVQWREFKWNPDFFMIIQGSQGVAGIKPYEEDIKRGHEKARAKNRAYDPAFDNTLRYQIVAFEKDRQIDPELLKSLGKAAGGEDDAVDDTRVTDPTVMRARGGIPSRTDARNLDNIFDRLSTFIGKINAIYYVRSHRPERVTPPEYKDVINPEFRGVRGSARQRSRDERFYQDEPAASQPVGRTPAGKGQKAPGEVVGTGGVEREKIRGRAELRKPASAQATDTQAVAAVYQRIEPIFKRLVFQASGMLSNRIKRMVDGGNYDTARQLASKAEFLKNILADLDTSEPVNINSAKYYNLRNVITASLEDANMSAQEVMDSSAAELAPLLDALRSRLTRA